MAVKYTNNATTTLNGAIDNSTTSITVVSAAVFPAVTTASGHHFYLTIIEGASLEIIRVTDVTGNVLTCTRGEDGTSGTAFGNGSRIDLRVTKAMLDDMVPQNKIDATTDPAASNDNTEGYSVDSKWVNLTTDTLFVCLDATTATAVWKQTSQVKHNYTATTTPSATDDAASGYSVGSRWVDVTNDKSYSCVDSTTSSAIWVGGGGGAAGGGADEVFFENNTNVTQDYTITTGKNAISAGPITVDAGVTVTVPSGSEWTVV